MASEKVMKSMVAVLILCNVSNADSDFFEPVSGYQAKDILTNVAFDGYDTYGSNVLCWNGNSLKIYNKNGTQTKDLGSPAGYSGWNSFVKLDPSGNSAWVGLTVSGNTDDRIYQVDLDSSTWTYKATLGGNFEVGFYESNVYALALNETLAYGTASIWLMDSTGNNNHDLIASIGGYSAGIALDAFGNIYYGTSGIGSGNTLVKFTAGQLAGAIGADYLELTDAILLSEIDGGAYDTDIDDAGNVIFSANGTESSYVAVWDGYTGSGTNYDLLGTGKGTVNWFSSIDSEGDMTDEGLLYQSDFYFDGLAEVTIPEPATIILLGLAGLWLRKRCNEKRIYN